MRNEDCKMLLLECKDLLVQIQEQHQKDFDLRKKEIISPKLKSFLEHSRSILEYCAMDTFENVIPEESKLAKLQSRNKNVYFPYGKNKEMFNKSINNNLPGLEQTSSLYKLIEGIQDYNQPNQKFLTYLCELTNVNKHNKLSRQLRNASVSFTAPGISMKGVKGVVFQGNTYNGIDMGEVIINDDDYIVNINPNFLSKTIISETGSFVFEDSEINILEFFNVVYTSIEKFTQEFYKIIKK